MLLLRCYTAATATALLLLALHDATAPLLLLLLLLLYTALGGRAEGRTSPRKSKKWRPARRDRSCLLLLLLLPLLLLLTGYCVFYGVVVIFYDLLWFVLRPLKGRPP